jgi:Tol biopolymer transport system component
MNRLPLWMVEGLAEYLTLGGTDNNTAMWLHDAVLRNDLPTIKQLAEDGRYFPYRYGQALWAYIAGRWGDDTIPALFRAALMRGVDEGILRVLGESTGVLSRQWQSAVRDAYLPLMHTRVRPESLGTRLLRPVSKTGDLDVSPALSPDGRYVAFITQRGLLQVDLYVADAESGKVIARLTSPNRDPEFDALNFIASAGSWSPDGKHLAYPVLAGGGVDIAIFDVDARRVARRVRVPEMGSVSDVAWGQGDRLAIAGTSGAMSDLLIYDLPTGTIEHVAKGRYAALQPAWSPDGRSLAFVTDSGRGTDFDTLAYGPMRIAVVELATHTRQLLPLFTQGKQINPQFGPDGESVYFIADPDGFADIYRFSVPNSEIERVTRVATGISGITALSPALSVAQRTGRLMFSVYEGAGFTLHRLEASEARAGETIASAASDNAGTSAGVSQSIEVSRGIVAGDIAGSTIDPSPAPPYPILPYHPALALDYIGTSGVGVAFGPAGAAAGGGVAAGFSDVLSDHVVGVQLMAAGELQDIGGGVTYLNQKRRWIWGVELSHTPYLSLVGGVANTTVTGPGGTNVPALLIQENRLRSYYEQGSLVAQYPLSMTRRLEFDAGYSYIHYGLSVNQSIALGGTVVQSRTYSGAAPAGLNLGQAGAAYVGDFSSFGLTSPVAGGRYRFEIDPTLGSLRFATAQLDYRRYLFVHPVTLAVRALHVGRYGPDGENTRLSALTVGDPLLVRGYDVNSFKPADCVGVVGGVVGSCPVFDRLIGSKIAVVNAEFRVPVVGTEQLGLIAFPSVPVEVAPFLDAGAAWTGAQRPQLEFSSTSGARIPVFSTGLTARVNVLGYVVVEGFYAYALQRPLRHNQFGFQLAPGW